MYSEQSVCDWVEEGCKTAGIGCLDCKQPVIDAVLRELKPMQERAKEYTEQPELVRSIINEGTEKARDVAKETLDEVKSAMGMNYL